jgi:outer membrane receptor protein involved in Fe transport
VHWLDLIAGARIEAYEGLSSSFTPRASAVVDLTPLFDDAPGRVLALRLGAGRAFKAPNLQEQYLDNPFILSNPDLEPETSTSWEAGLALRPRSGVFDATITWFQQRFEDLIRSVAVGDDGQQQNRNLGASRARGIEWQLAVRPSGTITVGTDGAWLRTRILDNSGLSSESFPEGEPLPFRPTIVASAFLETSLSPSVRANLRATHVGSQLVLTERFAGNRVELDAYTLAGVSINWDVRQGWTAYARFDNLFDAQYETAFDRRGIPATGAIGLQWHN